MSEKRNFYADFQDATHLIDGEIEVKAPTCREEEPPMVFIDLDAGSMLDYDARRLGELLIKAADFCESLESVSEPTTHKPPPYPAKTVTNDPN